MSRTRNLLLLAVVGAALLTVGYFGAQFMAENMAEQKVKEFFAGLDDVAHAEYGKVEVNLLDQEAVIHDLRVAILGGRTIGVGRFVLSRYEEKGGLPHVLKVRFSDVTLPVTPEYFGSSTADLRSMGYEELHCDYAMDYEYHEKDKRFDLRDFSLDVRDAGRLSLSLSLGNVRLEGLVKGGPGSMLVAVGDARLRYEDHSLVGRAVRAAARDEGLEEKAYLERLDGALEAEIGEAGKRGEDFAVRALEQLRRFMRGQKAISVSVAPPETVTILQLMGMRDVADVIKALGLDVEAD